MKPHYIDLKWEYGTTAKIVPYKKYYIEKTGNIHSLFGIIRYNDKSLYSKTLVDIQIYEILIRAINLYGII